MKKMQELIVALNVGGGKNKKLLKEFDKGRNQCKLCRINKYKKCLHNIQ